MEKKREKKKRKKLNWKAIGKLFLFVICIGAISYYIYELPVKNILIKGTNYVKDSEIIELVGVKDYPKIYHLQLKEMRETLEDLPLVASAKLTRNPFGKLTITIEENKVLFHNRNTDKLVLSNQEEIEPSPSFYGYPTLINIVPDTIYETLVKNLSKVDESIMSSVSEIEYAPSKNEKGEMMDETRFFFRMNDGNLVHINLLSDEYDHNNMEHLNDYQRIYTTLSDGEKGVLYLDSSNGENFSFRKYDSEEDKKDDKKEES